MIDLPELPDHYATLGVERAAEKAVIKKAWRKLAFALHPDRAAVQKLDEEETKKRETRFKTAQAAWEVLGDDEKRKKYEAELEFMAALAEVERAAEEQAQQRAEREKECEAEREAWDEAWEARQAARAAATIDPDPEPEPEPVQPRWNDFRPWEDNPAPRWQPSAAPREQAADAWRESAPYEQPSSFGRSSYGPNGYSRPASPRRGPLPTARRYTSTAMVRPAHVSRREWAFCTTAVRILES